MCDAKRTLEIIKSLQEDIQYWRNKAERLQERAEIVEAQRWVYNTKHKKRLLEDLNSAWARHDRFGEQRWWYTIGVISGETGLTGNKLDEELVRWEAEK